MRGWCANEAISCVDSHLLSPFQFLFGTILYSADKLKIALLPVSGFHAHDASALAIPGDVGRPGHARDRRSHFTHMYQEHPTAWLSPHSQFSISGATEIWR